jgi:predicted NBD/HSP70 family sugar kinase
VGISAPVTFDGQIGSQILGEKWSRDRPVDALKRRLSCPVLLDNDANLGALAEYTLGIADQVRCMLYVKAATGIGGGIVINGEVFRGASGTAGEIGHITLDPSGDPCRCGNRGCVELIAGGGHLLRLARTAHPELADLADLVRRANAKDSVCRRLVADAGRQLGTALGAVVGLYNPDAIVVGGALAEAEDLIPKIEDALADAVMPAASSAVRWIAAGQLGADASAWGGVMTVRRAADLPDWS